MNVAFHDTPESNVIEASELSCIRDDRILFESLSFRLQSAQVLLVEGENGCGKSSLLRILCGLRRPDSGEILWNSDPIEQLGINFHTHIAYVGHLNGIKLDLTVEENLEIAKSLGHPSNRSVSDVTRQIDLEGYEETPTRSLSAGQRRRLALGRLLVTQNKLWVLDEPFTALDKHGIKLFEDQICRYAANQGIVILSSHQDFDFNNLPIQRINLSQ